MADRQTQTEKQAGRQGEMKETDTDKKTDTDNENEKDIGERTEEREDKVLFR